MIISDEPSGSRSSWGKLIDYTQLLLKKGAVWAFHPKFDNSHLKRQIEEYLENFRLVDALTNVVIPTFNMKTLHPVVFSREQVTFLHLFYTIERKFFN